MEKQFMIIPYDEKFQPIFRQLNIDWIQSFGWPVEAADLVVLDNPVSNVIEKGGHIMIALYDGKPVGTIVIRPIANNPGNFELEKFTVASNIRGIGLGRKLLAAAIEKVKKMNATRLYLESNRRCESAIKLYRELGFREMIMQKSDFDRCDIQMEMILS